MDAKLIEKLDRRRYRSLLLIAISLPLLYVGLISTKLPDEWMIPGWIYPVFALPGVILLTIWAVMDKAIRSEMKKASELKNVLENELFKLYRYKSWQRGFYAFGITCFLFSLLENSIPALTVGNVILTIILIGCMTMFVSLLIDLRK